ncbi:MAG: hypothetical protein ACKVQB_07470 [Bacteroidia bacterium]
MKVLIGCEYSAIVRRAFEQQGHEAWSNDILPTEIDGNHLQCDILEAIKAQKWDFIGLHLPCTKIALCGNSTYGKGMKKHAERLEAIQWTKKIWEAAIQVCNKVYFENPKNVMGKHIGKHTQAIQPYQFGHLEQKDTWLWLYGLPKLTATNNVYNDMMLLPKNKRERIHHMSPSEKRGLERSRTYTGIAEAMAKQWSKNKIQQLF